MCLLYVQLQILEHAQQIPPKVTVAELLQQLTVTQAELENIKVNVLVDTFLPSYHSCHNSNAH